MREVRWRERSEADTLSWSREGGGRTSHLRESSTRVEVEGFFVTAAAESGAVFCFFLDVDDDAALLLAGLLAFRLRGLVDDEAEDADAEEEEEEDDATLEEDDEEEDFFFSLSCASDCSFAKSC